MQNPITLEEERKVWTIHQSVNGLTYYYNRATKKSQYEMPQCFKTTQQSLEHPEWKQYRTAQGKKFYYNASTRKSCWQLPTEVKEFRIKLEQKRKREKEEGGKAQEDEKLTEAEEIKRKFMSLLKAKSINANTKWDSCIKLCEDDDRWQLLKISDKKKYYNQYISELKKISEIEKKAKTEVNKAQFIKLLKQTKSLTSQSKMHKVALDLVIDPRWRLLEDAERQNTFQNYMDELASKERQEAKQIKARNCQLFKSTMEEDNIKYNTRWDEVRSNYKNNPYFKGLHLYDRISTFVQYILDAEKKHQEQQAKEKKLKEKSNRINFRNLIKEKLLNGQISYKTNWKAFVAQFKDDKNLLNMFDPLQTGSSAHQIFQNFMENIRENHKLMKSQIKLHFKKKSYRMTDKTQYAQFYDKLSDLESFCALKDVVKEYFHRYFQQKIKHKNQSKQLSAKKSSKRQRKIIFKIFKQLKDSLKTKYSIEDHMTKIQKGMLQFGIKITPESIFKYYLAFLEGYEDAQKKDASKSKSRSNSSSNDSKLPKRKRKFQQDMQEQSHKKQQPLLPAKPKQQKDGTEMQEEGEIKDDELEEKERKKKAKSSKKKHRSSSSDSD